MRKQRPLEISGKRNQKLYHWQNCFCKQKQKIKRRAWKRGKNKNKMRSNKMNNARRQHINMYANTHTHMECARKLQQRRAHKTITKSIRHNAKWIISYSLIQMNNMHFLIVCVCECMCVCAVMLLRILFSCWCILPFEVEEHFGRSAQ